MPNTTPNPILVTGANSYLGSFLIKLLLERGFKVRGTVRSLTNKPSYQFLSDLVPEKNNNLELIEAELTNKEVWSSATKGVQYVFHVASPTPFQKPPEDEEEYFVKPAVSGTLDVLEAALANGVKRVVVTSSVAAVGLRKDKIFTEEDWEDEEGLPSYPKSKIRAEKAAWEFYEKNKGKIEMAVVNPVFIFGPILNTKESSTTLIAMIMNGILPGVFDTLIPIVDVRDVAEVHYQAMFKEEANGKRYVCSAESVPLRDIVHLLNEKFGEKGVKISEKKVNVEELVKSENPGVQALGLMFGAPLKFDNKRSKDELGIDYRPVKQTIIDCGEGLLKFGIAKGKN